MTTENEAFEKFAETKGIPRRNFEESTDGKYFLAHVQEFFEYWQASKAESDKEIAGLKTSNETARYFLRDRSLVIEELTAQNAKFRKLLAEARHDVAHILDEHQKLLPFKKYRYDAQKEILDDIDEALL